MKLKVEIKDFDTEEVTSHEVGFIWGFGAFEIFEDTTGIDHTNMHIGVIQGNQKVLFNLAYAAIRNWSDVTKGDSDLPFTYRQFQHWLTGAEKGLGAKISDDFMKSAYEGGNMKDFYENIIASVEEPSGNKSKKKSRSAS